MKYNYSIGGQNTGLFFRYRINIFIVSCTGDRKRQRERKRRRNRVKERDTETEKERDVREWHRDREKDRERGRDTETVKGETQGIYIDRYPEWPHRQGGCLPAVAELHRSILCTRRSGGTAHVGGGCDQSIGSTVSDAIVRSWLWSTATRSSSLGYFSNYCK